MGMKETTMENRMADIKFSAFSFLKKKLNDEGVDCTSSPLNIPDDISVNALIEHIGLEASDVEAVFLNHKIMPKSTIIQNGDKIALVPPGGIPHHVAAYVGKNNN